MPVSLRREEGLKNRLDVWCCDAFRGGYTTRSAVLSRFNNADAGYTGERESREIHISIVRQSDVYVNARVYVCVCISSNWTCERRGSGSDW